MTVSEILMFFDQSQPCPASILNCEELRKQYKNDALLASQNNCGGCSSISLREKYIDILMNKK